MPASFAALDTDFVLALEGGYTGCQAAIDTLAKMGFHPLVSPCVEESLFWLSVNANNPALQRLAKESLAGFAAYNILKDDFPGMAKMLTRKCAEEWQEASLCADATINDYLVVTEASYLNARVLLTSSDPIINGEQVLKHKLADAHLNQVSVIDFRQFI